MNHGVLEIFYQLQSIQHSMNEQLSKVCSKLDDISGRIEGLETRQKSLEIEIKSFALSIIQVLFLQSRIRSNSFDEES